MLTNPQSNLKKSFIEVPNVKLALDNFNDIQTTAKFVAQEKNGTVVLIGEYDKPFIKKRLESRKETIEFLCIGVDR